MGWGMLRFSLSAWLFLAAVCTLFLARGETMGFRPCNAVVEDDVTAVRGRLGELPDSNAMAARAPIGIAANVDPADHDGKAPLPHANTGGGIVSLWEEAGAM